MLNSKITLQPFTVMSAKKV